MTMTPDPQYCTRCVQWLNGGACCDSTPEECDPSQMRLYDPSIPEKESGDAESTVE